MPTITIPRPDWSPLVRGWNRWGRTALSALALLGIGVGLFLAFKPQPRRSPPLQARLELAAGRVTVDSGKGALPVLSGAALPTDARVAAEAGARALIRLSDGTTLFLREQSALQLKPDGAQLTAGQFWMDAAATDRKPTVHHAGEVAISAADAGLDVMLKGSEVTVYVARGLAAVTAPGGRVEVRAGERVVVSGQAAPKVAPVTWWEDWTGGMADRRGATGGVGSGGATLYGIDIGGPAGSPARTLEVNRQAIRAVLRDGMAETEVDQVFFNPNARPVEGWYWFTIPAGAQVTGFALETEGRLVEGELIERSQARAQYAQAAAAGFDPALLEWVDARTFRARIFPVPAAGTRRAVLRYMQQLPLVEGRLRFVHPLRGREAQRIGEFSLTVDLGEEGTHMELSTLEEARIEEHGRRVTMRRSGFRPLADFQLEARLKESSPAVRLSRFPGDEESAGYLMARWVPDVDWSRVADPAADIVLVVDTSADADDAARQLKVATAEAILRALSAQDRFALFALDVKPVALHPAQGLVPAKDAEITQALERLADHASGGATDLAALFDVALGRLHGTEQPAIIYVGDGWATSGELGGEELVARLSRALSTSRARFFAVSVGGETNPKLLSELARAGGGQLFTVDETDQATDQALRLAAAVKTPTITDLEVDLGAGLDEVFLSSNGKVSRGEEVVLLARSHHDLPSHAKIRGRLAGKPFAREVPVTDQPSLASSLVPRLWAAEAIRRQLGTAADPDAVRGRVVAIGLEYGLMTPYTSFLALESDEAYQRMGIPRRQSPLRGARLSAITSEEGERQALAEAGLFVATAAFGCSSSEQSAPPTTAGAPARRRDIANMVATSTPDFATARAMGAPQEQMAKSKDRGAMDEMKALAPAPSVAAGLASPALSRGALGRESAKAENRSVLAIAPVCSRTLEPRSACSDLARRPLADRAVVWAQRLRTAESTGELLQRYDAARDACELSDWRAEARFLQLLQHKLQSPEAVSAALARFSCTRDAQLYLARLVMRRAVDPALIAAVQRSLTGEAVDWVQVDRELSAIADPERRLAVVRAAVARAPDDAQGLSRLCHALARAGHGPEALTQARKLRERGLINPLALREVGDTLAQLGHADEALRTYSEIVEFDPASVASRSLLGDIFLARGWYDSAYLQYRTLTSLRPADWSGWLRLASAAAGAGRVDEALRLERQVAEAEGTPGPSDPRRWARLWTAARVARLMEAPPAEAGDAARTREGMKRQLKELQLLPAPGAWVVMTWEDLAVDLALASEGRDGVADAVDAAPVGLAALQFDQADAAASARPLVRVRGGHRSGAVRLLRHDIAPLFAG